MESPDLAGLFADRRRIGGQLRRVINVLPLARSWSVSVQGLAGLVAGPSGLNENCVRR